MGQQNSSFEELKKLVLNHEDLTIDNLLEDMLEEGIIDPKAIKNPHAISKDGRILIEVNRKRDDYIEVICPFHPTDNDGSARLNIRENYLKCFVGSCRANKPMNPIDLYMALKFNVDPKLFGTDASGKEFVQAVKELADRLGIHYDTSSKKLTDEELKANRMLAIRARFAEIYHRALKEHKNRQFAIDYMKNERGFKYGVVPFEELVEEYKIGYAPGWSYAYNFAKKQFSLEEMIEAGVVRKIQNKDTGKEEVRDFLGGGVVLPYFSNKKINNLYARNIMTKNKNFRHLRLKGNVDIPINFDEAKKHQRVIIVEGEFSWLSLIAMGYKNAMANRGTNGLTDEHVAMLKEMRDKTDGDSCGIIYLCFDPDSPGRAAAEKTGEKLVSEGFDVRVIRLGKGDPNDFLQEYKENAKPAFDKLMDEALSYYGFMMVHSLHKLKNKGLLKTKADKVYAIEKIGQYVEKTPKAQLTMIAFEVEDEFEQDGFSAALLHKLWLGFDGTPIQKPKIINPGFKIASQHFWLFLTDDKKLYDAMLDNGALETVVYVNDMQKLIRDVRNKPGITSILFDTKMKEANKKIMFDGLSDRKFKVFLGSSLDKIKDASESELLSMTKSFDASSSQVS